MFHTNKMPKIIVFRVVIEGTAPTEGPPTACNGKRPSCPKRAQRPPSHPAPNARASASSFATCESHFRAHICARLQFQAAPPMSRLQLQAACLCQPAWSACVSP